MRRLAPVVLALLLPAVALAEPFESQPKEPEVATDYEAGQGAIARKDWSGAIKSLDKAAKANPSDADVQNLLGYAHRKRGNLETAFRHYDRALALDPKHLGAHEYVGEAYLMTGNLPKAKEHLAALDKLCPAGCEQREDLRTAIAAFEKAR